MHHLPQYRNDERVLALCCSTQLLRNILQASYQVAFSSIGLRHLASSCQAGVGGLSDVYMSLQHQSLHLYFLLPVSKERVKFALI